MNTRALNYLPHVSLCARLGDMQYECEGLYVLLIIISREKNCGVSYYNISEFAANLWLEGEIKDSLRARKEKEGGEREK